MDLDLQAFPLRRRSQHEGARVLSDVEYHGLARIGRPG